jgi:hypothetical protein
MANYYVTNSKYPSNPQVFTIALHKVASIQGEENPNFVPTFPQAERYWKMFIYTSGLDSEGESVGPIVSDITGSAETVNKFVENTLADLCALIDWSQQGQVDPEIDRNAPLVSEQYPTNGQPNVSISSPVVLRIIDPLPGVGVDPSTVSMKIDGYDVTPNITGNKFDYTFSFSPRPIYDS